MGTLASRTGNQQRRRYIPPDPAKLPKGKGDPMDPMKQRALAAYKLETWKQKQRGIKRPRVALKIPRTSWMNAFCKTADNALRSIEGIRILFEKDIVSLENTIRILCDDSVSDQIKGMLCVFLVQARIIESPSETYEDIDLIDAVRWNQERGKNPWKNMPPGHDGDKVQLLKSYVHRSLKNEALDIIFQGDKIASWQLARRIAFIAICYPEYYETQIARLIHPLNAHCKGIASIDWLHTMYGFQSSLLNEDDSEDEDTETE